jgi:hypothetical protein
MLKQALLPGNCCAKFPITVHLWTVSIDTKVFSNILTVQFKTCIHKEPGETRAKQGKKQTYRDDPSKH